MTNLAIIYLIINIILLVYACYSWFWQASIDLKAHYRISSVIWALVFVWFGFSWNYLGGGSKGLIFFLALFLLVSIIDGFTGFTKKRVVLSGYFRRTLRYSDINLVTLIKVSGSKKKIVMCLLTTKKNRQYTLRLSQSVAEIVVKLKGYLNHGTHIEIQDFGL